MNAPTRTVTVEPLTAEEEAKERPWHKPIETGPGWYRCAFDREVWPCFASRLGATLDDLRSATEGRTEATLRAVAALPEFVDSDGSDCVGAIGRAEALSAIARAASPTETKDADL